MREDTARNMVVSYDSTRGSLVVAVLTESGKVLLLGGDRDRAMLEVGVFKERTFVPSALPESVSLVHVPVYRCSPCYGQSWQRWCG